MTKMKPMTSRKAQIQLILEALILPSAPETTREPEEEEGQQVDVQRATIILMVKRDMNDIVIEVHV